MHQHLCVFVLFCCLATSAYAGWEYRGKESWSYVNVRKDAYMFWWLIYADTDGDNYKTYPLIVWLQGGPGSSSTGYGNFMELGPLDINMKPRNTSWVKLSNVLFIDNPVGTGYSYITNDTAYATNNTQIADDLVTLMGNFFNKLPEFQKVPLYIFCESYGGKMAASFALALYKAIHNGKIPCTFKGVALGDGWLSPVDSVSTWGQYLYTMSLLDQAGLNEVGKSVDGIKEALSDGQNTKATQLWSSLEDLIEKLTAGVDWYNILTPMTPQNSTLKISLPEKNPFYKSFQRHVARFYGDPLYELMNGPIKEKLHVIPKNITWGGQAGNVFTALMGDFMVPIYETVDRLLNETDLKVVVYTGQLDLIVDTLGTLQWVDRLVWPGIKSFQQATRKPVVVSNQTAGFVKSFKNLSMFWILKAGHMVPADAGEAALKMVEMIISGNLDK